MDYKYIIIGLVVIIIALCAVMIIPHGENTNVNDDSNITIIKNSTKGYAYVSQSTNDEYYYYNLEGIMKNLPSNLKGYTEKSIFYDENGEYLHESTCDVANLYESAQNDELYNIAHWEAKSLYNVGKIEVIVENPNGEIVYNQSFTFDMSKMDLTALDDSNSSDSNSAHYSVEGQVDGKSYSYDVDLNTK